ncbi:MAG: hypothetical protein WA924_08490, partial [Burkholderiaceae bacterium]
IGQMDEMTQQNAALVEQAAAAAESMKAQAVQLAQAVSVFRLEAEELSGRPETHDLAEVRVTGATSSKRLSVAETLPRKKIAAAAGGGDEDWAEF